MVLKWLALFVHLQRTAKFTNPKINPNDTCDMIRSSANTVVTCDYLTKMLLVITVTANSNKQALGFVSCAQVSKGLTTQKSLQDLRLGKTKNKKASVDQPEAECEHVMVNTPSRNTSP